MLRSKRKVSKKNSVRSRQHNRTRKDSLWNFDIVEETRALRGEHHRAWRRAVVRQCRSRCVAVQCVGAVSPANDRVTADTVGRLEVNVDAGREERGRDDVDVVGYVEDRHVRSRKDSWVFVQAFIPLAVPLNGLVELRDQAADAVSAGERRIADTRRKNAPSLRRAQRVRCRGSACQHSACAAPAC